jgi:hypothetical protein
MNASQEIYIATAVLKLIKTISVDILSQPVAYPGIFFEGWGGQQIQLRTEGRENGDLGGGSPLVRGSAQFANE